MVVPAPGQRARRRASWLAFAREHARRLQGAAVRRGPHRAAAPQPRRQGPQAGRCASRPSWGSPAPLSRPPRPTPEEERAHRRDRPRTRRHRRPRPDAHARARLRAVHRAPAELRRGRLVGRGRAGRRRRREAQRAQGAAASTRSSTPPCGASAATSRGSSASPSRSTSTSSWPPASTPTTSCPHQYEHRGPGLLRSTCRADPMVDDVRRATSTDGHRRHRASRRRSSSAPSTARA